MAGNVNWIEGSQGIEFDDAAGQMAYANGTPQDSSKLYDRITVSGSFAVEAWIENIISPDEVPSPPKRIVSYSIDQANRNFMMSKTTDTHFYSFRVTNSNIGEPDLSIEDPNVLKANVIQHVVMTFSVNQGRKIYVDQINNSMASITGVNPNTVQTVYANLKQELPAISNIKAFSSTNQTAIRNLALHYCDTLMNNVDLRTSFFETTDFTIPGNQSQIVSILIDKMVGNVLTQPPKTNVAVELNSMVDALKTNSIPDLSIVTSACMVMLSSATLSIQ